MQKKNEIKDFYVVGKGALQIVRDYEKEKMKRQAKPLKTSNDENILIVGELFGNMTLISHLKWESADVYAIENSIIIIFNTNVLHQLIKEACGQPDYKEKYDLLGELFPFFNTINYVEQRKIVDSFKSIVY